ncbi:DUF6701 domain-containing protein [Idiomarina zobellii]|uniref:DUF6701 domain-containing protein n=1 Tax=Idiomarina zobellii TaxID=86103 RepID=UPI0006B5CD41|nr:DUF6701 domain-containing protein [Idiomarina zobellii]SDF64197.1 MSHA biogenesis protein MshQ [Idiomarina zobellii]
MYIRYSPLMVLAFLLFTPLVEAKTYQIPPPGNSGKEVFPDCDYDRNTSTFQCDSGLELNDGDIIEFRGNPSLPITINVKEDVSLGDRVKVNSGGSAQDLQFDIGGNFTVGDDASVAATIKKADEVSIGDRTKELGAISANNVGLGSQSQITGGIGASSDVEIDSQANVSGTVRAGGKVSIESQAKIFGDVISGGEIESDNGVEFGGSIQSGDSIELGDRSEIAGSIISTDEVKIGEGSNVQGGITTLSSKGDIDIGNRTKVIGEINGSADFSAGKGTVFENNINSSGKVDLEDRARVDGYVDAGGDLSLGQQGSVKGDIKAGGKVDLTFLAEVDGSIDADGNVSLGTQGRIKGNINSRGDVELEVRSTVEGYVNAKNGDEDGDLGEGSVIGLTCNRNNNRGPCDGEPPSPSLGKLGYWKFDESQWQGSSGEVLDSSGNDLNGVALRGASTEGSEPAISGSPGTCGYGMFDGNNAVRVNNAASIASAESISVAFWFKGEAREQDQRESYQTLLMMGDGPTESAFGRFEVYRQDRSDGGGIYFEIRNDNGSLFKVEAGNAQRGQDSLFDNTWHHLAASYDKSARRLRLYIDGQLVDETSINRSYTLNPVSDNLYIGGQGTSDFSFNGEIDEVFIGNRSLTSDEVTTLKERTRPCGNERPLCEAVWPERGTSNNSIPIPFSLPGSQWENQLPANLQPIDYLRTGDFEDVGENYSTNGQTSRVYIDGDLTIKSGRRINRNGDANELILVVTGDLNLEQNVKINGYIYVAGDLSYESSIFYQTEITGSISVGGRVQGNDWWDWWNVFGPDITYQRPTEPIEGGSFCRATDSEPPVLSLHHYQLSYSSPALTCSGAPVDIKACANFDCSETYPAEATVELSTLVGEWSSNPVAVSPLSRSTLKQVNAGTYTLAIDNGETSPQPQNSARCIVNGSLSENCNIEFRDTGFIFTNGDNLDSKDIPRQISAEPYNNLKLWAVETNTQTFACEAILEPLNSVSMSMNCVDPDECLMGTTVNGREVVENTFSDVDIDFDDGKADLQVNYADAGAITLTARAELANGEIQGTSEAFVWAPTSIRVEPFQSSPGSYQSGILAKAGEEFTAKLTARNSQGDITPNFGNETVPETLQLKPETQAIGPAIRDGMLSNANGFDKVGNGIFRNEGLSYSEVGLTRVTAYIESENYLPGYHSLGFELEVSSELTEIGRFIPYEFEPLTAKFTGTCTDFHYMEQAQPIELSAQAINASGNKTFNYTGSLAKAEPLFYAYDSSGNQLVNHAVSYNGVWEWGEGVGQFTGSASVTVSRLSSGQPDGPFKDYILGWQLDDQENGNFYSTLQNSVLPASNGATELDSANLYYGRLNLQDTYAAMDDVMPIAGAVEYWESGEFYANDADNCTVVDRSDVSLLDESMASLEPAPTNVKLTNGLLSSPNKEINQLFRWVSSGAEDPYSFIFELDTDYLKYDWSGDGSFDENPQAEGTFGIYRGRDRQIYWRELGW